MAGAAFAEPAERLLDEVDQAAQNTAAALPASADRWEGTEKGPGGAGVVLGGGGACTCSASPCLQTNVGR